MPRYKQHGEAADKAGQPLPGQLGPPPGGIDRAQRSPEIEVVLKARPNWTLRWGGVVLLIIGGVGMWWSMNLGSISPSDHHVQRGPIDDAPTAKTVVPVLVTALQINPVEIDVDSIQRRISGEGFGLTREEIERVVSYYGLRQGAAAKSSSEAPAGR